MADPAIMKIDMTSFFSAEGGPIWIKFRRLVQNDMSTAVLPLGEFTVTIPEPLVTLQGAVT